MEPMELGREDEVLGTPYTGYGSLPPSSPSNYGVITSGKGKALKKGKQTKKSSKKEGKNAKEVLPSVNQKLLYNE